MPKEVILCEVGPRDGFQYEETVIPTDLKVDVVRELAAAGLSRIQVASFVHPEKVPQMADAEEVVARLADIEGVTLSGLALNRVGVERARDSGLRAVDISMATWDDHSLENAGMTVDEALEQAVEMVAIATEADLEVQVGLQTVFGFRKPGDTPIAHIVGMVERFVRTGIDSISLADTTGMANPVSIASRVEAVRRVAVDVPIVLHLHDTRGLGLANVYEAVRCGVDRFDTAFGGMGGCPFIRGAAGNVPTEDTAFLLASLGISTGVDISAVASVSHRLADYLKKDLRGRLYRLFD